MKFATKLLACLGLAWGITAQAATTSYNFYCITNLSPNCSTGVSQLSVDVSSTSNPSQVLFTFKNTGSAASSITDVYFDDGTLLGIASITSSTGVSFSQVKVSPPDLPGGNSITPQFQTTAGFLADSNSPASPNGVNPDEWLGILFDLKSSQTYTNVLAALDSAHINQPDDLRIGIHVQSFSDGVSASFVNVPTAVPTPAAVWLLGSGLIGLAGVARKKAL